jgi:hypothetical protein
MTEQTVSQFTSQTPTRRKIWNPEFLTVSAFCAVGILVTLNVLLRMPDAGAVLLQFNQF